MIEPLLIALVIASDVLMYVTLPLHARLLYVLVRPSKKVALDGSFLTLMINSTIVNLLYSLDFCLIQAPAMSGLFYEFYKDIGSIASHPTMIRATTLILLGSALHLVLAFSRFTAIRMPTNHDGIWRRLPYICGSLWLLIFLISIPLILPGSTNYLERSANVFGFPCIEFTFMGNYFMIYSIGMSSIGGIFEIITIFFYSGMIIGFRRFIRASRNASTEIKRMKMGVIRTTVAAMCTSLGSWIIVLFFVIAYGYLFSTGKPMVTDNVFSSIFGLLNAINNILTPWVLLFAFPNVRFAVFNSSLNNKIGIAIDQQVNKSKKAASNPVSKSLVSVNVK